jgi:hypothetical protein
MFCLFVVVVVVVVVGGWSHYARMDTSHSLQAVAFLHEVNTGGDQGSGQAVSLPRISELLRLRQTRILGSQIVEECSC